MPTFEDPILILIMLVLFVGVLYWAFRPKNRKRFQKDAEIPFHDDEDKGGPPVR